MRTELDQRMDAVIAALTAQGGPAALGEIERYGVKLPFIAAAPPTLPAYFAHFCTQHRDVEFLVAGDERLTYGQVYDAATRVAHALVGAFGVRKGDRIGIAARNSPSWIVLYMGILMAGGVATLLNGWWQAEEMEASLADVGVSLVFVDPPRAKRLAAIAGLTVPVETFDDLQPLETALDGVFARATAGDGSELPALTGDDHATILFTSGSTGQSKGALSTHFQVTQGVFNYLSSALMMLAMQAAKSSDPKVYKDQVMNVANAPGEKIGPGELAKGLELLAAGTDIDFVGATSVELVGPGESAGVYREVDFPEGKIHVVKLH